MQSFVQFIHELRRRGVADFPQSRYNVVRPSAKKSPSQTNKPFPRVGFHSSPITRGNGYQVGVPWVLDDVARIKLVCTAFRRKNHRRFEGTNGTGGPVDRKSTRLNSSHLGNSYAVFCLKNKNLAERLDGLVELHASALDLHAMLVEEVDEILRGDRAEELAFLGCLTPILVGERFDHVAKSLGVALDAIGLGVRLLLDVIEVLEIAR